MTRLSDAVSRTDRVCADVRGIVPSHRVMAAWAATVNPLTGVADRSEMAGRPIREPRMRARCWPAHWGRRHAPRVWC